jgi:imidazolonepropionase
MLLAVEALPESRRPRFCDVFCEEGAFTVKQSRHILECAIVHGMRPKIHADEFRSIGAVSLGVELGAISVDHLVTTTPEEIELLGRSHTVAVTLPGTPFGLGHHDYSPARGLISAGAAVALATDANPGTTPCESMQMMLALACRYMRLSPTEAIVAATVNAAHAIGLGHRVGSLEPGKQADLLILEVPTDRMLPYRYGTNMVQTVVKKGKVVYPA